MPHAQTGKKKQPLSFHFPTSRKQPIPSCLLCAQMLSFLPAFSLQLFSSLQRKEKKRETFPYLGRIVVVLAELRLGSTLERVTSSVKSCLLVPCMWKNETRVHTRVKKTTPRLLLASNSSPRQCERA